MKEKYGEDVFERMKKDLEEGEGWWVLSGSEIRYHSYSL